MNMFFVFIDLDVVVNNDRVCIELYDFMVIIWSIEIYCFLNVELGLEEYNVIVK